MEEHHISYHGKVEAKTIISVPLKFNSPTQRICLLGAHCQEGFTFQDGLDQVAAAPGELQGCLRMLPEAVGALRANPALRFPCMLNPKAPLNFSPPLYQPVDFLPKVPALFQEPLGRSWWW